MNVGVHQGSVLSLLLFILVLEALSQEFRTGCPWHLLFADDLVTIAESAEELCRKLTSWKVNLDNKGCEHEEDQTHIPWSKYEHVVRLWYVALWSLPIWCG